MADPEQQGGGGVKTHRILLIVGLFLGEITGFLLFVHVSLNVLKMSHDGGGGGGERIEKFSKLITFFSHVQTFCKKMPVTRYMYMLRDVRNQPWEEGGSEICFSRNLIEDCLKNPIVQIAV